MAKKSMILLCLFSVFTFICSLISTIIVISNENARTALNSAEVLASNKKYLTTTIDYEQSNELNLVGLNPGNQFTHNFSITNNQSNTIKYSIKWYNVFSNWTEVSPLINEAKPDEFVYSLSCTNGEKLENKQMPSQNDDLTILDDLELKTNKTNNCSITITFVSTGLDQSYNLNKTFKGTYKIVVKE